MGGTGSDVIACTEATTAPPRRRDSRRRTQHAALARRCPTDRNYPSIMDS